MNGLLNALVHGLSGLIGFDDIAKIKPEKRQNRRHKGSRRYVQAKGRRHTSQRHRSNRRKAQRR